MALPSWLSLSKLSGSGNDIVDVTVEPNEGESRETTLYISGNGLTESVDVRQYLTLDRNITVYVQLNSFGSTAKNGLIYENIYRVYAESDYPINGGKIYLKLSYVKPNSVSTSNIQLIFNDGDSVTSSSYIFISSKGLFDSTTRLSAKYIEENFSVSVEANETSFNIKSTVVKYGETGILRIGDKFLPTINLEIYDEYNQNIIQTGTNKIANLKNLIVSWPYAGGLNQCTYRCTKSKEGSYIYFDFGLTTRYFNNGSEQLLYYDIWNSIMNDGYNPIKKFRLKCTVDSSGNVTDLALDNIETLDGNQGVGLVTVNAVASKITSIPTPIYSGLIDKYLTYNYTIYKGIRRINMTSSGNKVDSNQICWYHNILSGDTIASTILRSCKDIGFPSAWVGTQVINCVLNNTETSATLESTTTYSSSNIDMEKFYHPSIHPNNISF